MQAVAALNSTLFSLVDRLPIILVFSLPILDSLVCDGDQTVRQQNVPYQVDDIWAAGRGIRYLYLIATTVLYGSGGQVAFGSLGVTDVYELPTLGDGIRWMHAVCGYPAKDTWIKAI